MPEELAFIKDILLKKFNLNISKLEKDLECEDYMGYNFVLNDLNIKFRKAKITPKKNGQFVTLWKRNSKGETEPYDSQDKFDFYFIVCEENNQKGIFIFSKKILIEKKILTNNLLEGKRGFRIYAIWNIPESNQATKTKSWQEKFFIDFTEKEKIDLKKFKEVISNNQNTI